MKSIVLTILACSAFGVAAADMPQPPGTVILKNSADFQTDPASIREIQLRLNQRGFQTYVDGVWSAHTQAALQRFQQAQGITPSGHVNQQTLTALGYPVVPGKGATGGSPPDAGAGVITPAPAAIVPPPPVPAELR